MQPHLYTAVVKVLGGGAVRDAERVSFGIRSARFDADKGFFLNDKSLKIQGTCNHQDHAGVGAALPDSLQTSACPCCRRWAATPCAPRTTCRPRNGSRRATGMGVMMMCETRQMSSNPEGLAELELMVKRYRNSPSIIIWSIGNEEWLLQKAKWRRRARRSRATMVRRCHELDPTRVVSAAVNGNNEQGVSDPARHHRVQL